MIAIFMTCRIGHMRSTCLDHAVEAFGIALLTIQRPEGDTSTRLTFLESNQNLVLVREGYAHW